VNAQLAFAICRVVDMPNVTIDHNPGKRGQPIHEPEMKLIVVPFGGHQSYHVPTLLNHVLEVFIVAPRPPPQLLFASDWWSKRKQTLIPT
jgi:hypothetical protein